MGPFRSIHDLAKAIEGPTNRLLRLEFLRGDYSCLRRVTAQLEIPGDGKDRIAA